jgi:uncharacterized membrane protein YoaK (UPF0700 family)
VSFVPQEMRPAERALFIGTLAWAAGAVDALGFLLLGGVFTSHVTGNTTAVVVAFLTGAAAHPTERLLALTGFGGGALGGALLIECHRHHSAVGALWFEAALLLFATLLVSPSRRTPALVDSELLVVAAAMGIQNIALAGSTLNTHTTHITGPFTDLASVVARRLVGRRRLPRDRSHGWLVYGGRVAAFAAGTASGAMLFLRLGERAFAAPASVVLASGILLWRRPQAPREIAETD